MSLRHWPGPPILFVLSGPSGVGKDTVIQRLRPHLADLSFAVTATTRAVRAGEKPGVSYHFLSRDEYDDLLNRGELLAAANVHGNWYGAPLGPIRDAFVRGQDVLLKIDVQGAAQVRARFPQAVSIFLGPPSLDDLVDRLRARHTETPAELERRLRDAVEEMQQLPYYDYVVVNCEDYVDEAVDGVRCIIAAERLRVHREPIDLTKR